jgi:23S rRNA pseudouridine1911/1915/1917 synthase
MIPFDPKKQIVYEDNHIIVVDKQPSQIVQGDKTGDEPLSESLKQYLKQKFNKPGNVFLGVVHRLDRPVSGLVVFSRTSKALARLNKQIADKSIKKTYWAVVRNRPKTESGQLIHYLAKDEKKNKSFVVSATRKDAKQAVLDYRLIGGSDTYYLLEIMLQTGRHHQIRVQLSKMGCPIKGDLKYGYPRSNETAFIHLHARQLEFTHPVSKQAMQFVAEPPHDPLWNYFAGHQP